MTVTLPTTIKRRDAVTLTLHLETTPGVAADLTGYTGARVIVSRLGQTPIVSRAGVIATDPTTGVVTIALTSGDTAIDGDYRVEVEMTPGPHTWPSGGWLLLRILPDLG